MGETFIVRRGGGGAGINFKVVGGTVQPANPKENTVWVNTTTDISSWVVSPNQPGNPADGMVWIQDGNANGINIVKKNAVEVFPSGCKLYTDGAWANVEAYLFRNGAWVQFAFLYIPVTLSVYHPINGSYISITIRDKDTSEIITNGTLSGTYQFAYMTDNTYTFNYKGISAKLVCTVAAGVFRATLSVLVGADYEQRSAFSGGIPGNTSLDWSFTQDGIM